MIAIINQGKKRKGLTLYHLKINDELITKFWHKREDGLGKCLEIASQKAKKYEISMQKRILRIEKEFIKNNLR